MNTFRQVDNLAPNPTLLVHWLHSSGIEAQMVFNKNARMPVPAHPWVGATLALVDLAVFIYDITKDNELQNWMQESRFGEGDGLRSRHFKNARQEADQLILIFEVKRQEIIDQINEEIRKNQEGQQKSYQNMAASAIRASGGQHVFDYIGNTWR